MKFEPTNEQKRAIYSKGSTIVSAAAGSGKTAVLVQRVISKLKDTEKMISADRLLILTFTNSAAAEMKGRIEKALADLSAEEPDNMYIKKQLLLLPLADICTIDSYCMKIVRNYFSVLQVPPDFRIIDSGAEILLMNETVQEIFHNKYESDDEEFLFFLNSTDSLYSDDNATAAVIKLYRFCQSLPFPEYWAKHILEVLKCTDISKNPLTADIFKNVSEQAKELCEKCNMFRDIINKDKNIFKKYGEKIKLISDFASKLYNASQNCDWDMIKESFDTFPSLNSKPRSSAYSPEAIEAVGILYDCTKRIISKNKAMFGKDIKSVERELELQYRSTKKLVELYLEFNSLYFKKLTEKGYLTFSFCEQLVIKLLCSPDENGNPVNTKYADSISSLYDELLFDEFQDVNNLQDTILNIISHNGERLFAVGDVKQSIYVFRLSNPENFINRLNASKDYDESIPENLAKNIVLSGNFRSRARVCDFINKFFSIFMNERTGGVEYSKREFLNPCAKYVENNEVCTELHYYSTDENISDNTASVINLADIICDLVKKEPFLDDGKGGLRKAEYRDIAIISRTKTHFKLISEIFAKRNIPISIPDSTFFGNGEIELLTSLIKTICNPLNDISLLSAMLSPVFSFTANEVAKLRAKDSYSPIYKLLLNAKDDLHCREVVEKLSEYRRKAAVCTVGMLVSEIINDSGFSEIASRISDRAKSEKRLILFQNIADNFQSDGGNDLSAFASYIDKIASCGDFDVSSGSSENTVSLCSVHKSKGLQYPICIITNNSLNGRNDGFNIEFDNNAGIAYDMLDTENNVIVKTLTQKIIHQRNSIKGLREEMRIYYVAMTRAKEKLIFQLKTPSSNKISSFKPAIESFNGKTYPDDVITDGKTFGDWLYLFDEAVENNGLYKRFEDTVSDTDECEVMPESNDTTVDTDYENNLKKILSYEYPYKKLRSIEAKTSVSELTKREAERSFCASSRPAFMSETGLSATERGTAFHKFMQFADFENAPHNIPDEIERLYEQEYISRAESDSLSVQKIKDFFDSTLFKRITASKKYLREQRFMLDISAFEFDETLNASIKNIPVTVQGAVDCLFFEDDGIVVIDFKTDRVKTAKELIPYYSEQLKVYCRAAQKMFQMPVKECFLYSLHNGETARVII